MKRLSSWFKNTGVLHSLVLYRCVHLQGVYGVRVPFWYSQNKVINTIVDQVLEVCPFEPTSEMIKEMRRGVGIDAVDVW